MANNRLFITDSITGDRIMVAKSFGDGWVWEKSKAEMQEWLDKHERDIDAAWGGVGDAKSSLIFETENMSSKG